MPVITVAIGQSDPALKKRLIEGLTAEAIAITGIPANEFTTFVQEYPIENVGRAGKILAEYRAAGSR